MRLTIMVSLMACTPIYTAICSKLELLDTRITLFLEEQHILSV